MDFESQDLFSIASGKPLQLVVAKVASDVNMFETLSRTSSRSMSSTELAKAAGTDPILLSEFGFTFLPQLRC